MRWSRRLAVVPLVGSVALAVGCGTTDQASDETLPPIRTTTSTTSTTTTIPTDRFYTIQRGDTLFLIADQYQVTVDAIVRLNGLADPNDIEAGQTIEIPANDRRARRPAPTPAPASSTG